MSRTFFPFFLGSALFFCLVTSAKSASFPESFEAVYELKKGFVTFGETRRTLKKLEQGRFTYESKTKPTGFAAFFVKGEVSEKSIWQFQGERLQPLEFSYLNTGGGKKREVELKFDWQAKKVTNRINGDPWTMALTDGTLDKLLYQLSLMKDLAAGKKQMKYAIADGGKLKTYDIRVRGEETIETPAGKFDTIIVAREGDERSTTMWCAKSLNYLPVKIQQIEADGNRFSAELSQVKGLPVR